MLVRAGAVVGARIVRFRQFYGKSAYLSLEIKLETVEVGATGAAIRLNAAPDRGIDLGRAGKDTLKRRVELGTITGLADRSVAYRFPNDPKKPYLIHSSLQSSWITLDP